MGKKGEGKEKIKGMGYKRDSNLIDEESVNKCMKLIMGNGIINNKNNSTNNNDNNNNINNNNNCTTNNYDNNNKYTDYVPYLMLVAACSTRDRSIQGTRSRKRQQNDQRAFLRTSVYHPKQEPSQRTERNWKTACLAGLNVDVNVIGQLTDRSGKKERERENSD